MSCPVCRCISEPAESAAVRRDPQGMLVAFPRVATLLQRFLPAPEGRASQGPWPRCAFCQGVRPLPARRALPGNLAGTLKCNELAGQDTRAPLNNGNRAQRSAEVSRARRAAQVMAIALGKWRNAALDTSGPALRGFQANPHCALPLFDRQPACLQSGALDCVVPESLSALPLFRGALEGHSALVSFQVSGDHHPA